MRVLKVAPFATVLLIGSTAATCHRPKPVVTEIEVVPGLVAASSDAARPTTFVLEARLWTWLGSKREELLESDGVKPTWSYSPTGSGVSIVGSNKGYRVTLRVDPGTNPTALVTVKAQAGGMGAESKIVPSLTSGHDQFEAAYADGLIPDAAVSRGLRNPTGPCGVWLPPALVRTGTAGSFTADCSGPGPSWGLALLDAAQGMEMYQASWTAGTDKVPSPNPLTALRAIPMAVRVFIGGTGNLASRQRSAWSFMLQEIEDANSVFGDNRVGIKLVVQDTQTVTPVPPTDETTLFDCPDGDLLTTGKDHSPAMLHIYLVNDVLNADGIACSASNTRPQAVIYVDMRRSGTILLHEVGHALGLSVPRDGHWEDVTGLDPANVMASGYAVSDKVWRRRLTVGQVFRMNADLGSWLNWATDPLGTPLRDPAAPRLACQCGHDDPPGPCPRLVEDVAQPRGGSGEALPWECGDRIKLPALTDEAPLALIAGRRWRTPLGDCRDSIPGRYKFDADLNADFIEIDNLTRPGSCPSWVAVFFQKHAPIFRDLAASPMPGGWTDAGERQLLARSLAPLPIVSVTVLHDPLDAAKANAGIADAVQVFGERNLTGIDLRLTPQAGTLPSQCPTPPPYVVCYSSASGVSVPQLVGQVLELPPLSPSDLANSAFAGNAMQSPPGTPGKLTLGQVFRIHAGLGTGDFPKCSAPGASCPPPGADVSP